MQWMPAATSPGATIPGSRYVAVNQARASRGTAPSNGMNPPFVATTSSSRRTSPRAAAAARAARIARSLRWWR